MADTHPRRKHGRGRWSVGDKVRGLFREFPLSRQTVVLTALTIAGASLFGAGWMIGWTDLPFKEDASHLTLFMAVLFLLGIERCYRKDWRGVRFIKTALPYLGFAGTILGFVMGFHAIDIDRVKDVSAIAPMVGAMFGAMGTALWTSMVGVVGYLWLTWMHYLFCATEE